MSCYSCKQPTCNGQCSGWDVMDRIRLSIIDDCTLCISTPDGVARIDLRSAIQKCQSITSLYLKSNGDLCYLDERGVETCINSCRIAETFTLKCIKDVSDETPCHDCSWLMWRKGNPEAGIPDQWGPYFPPDATELYKVLGLNADGCPVALSDPTPNNDADQTCYYLQHQGNTSKWKKIADGTPIYLVGLDGNCCLVRYKGAPSTDCKHLILDNAGNPQFVTPPPAVVVCPQSDLYAVGQAVNGIYIGGPSGTAPNGNSIGAMGKCVLTNNSTCKVTYRFVANFSNCVGITSAPYDIEIGAFARLIAGPGKISAFTSGLSHEFHQMGHLQGQAIPPQAIVTAAGQTSWTVQLAAGESAEIEFGTQYRVHTGSISNIQSTVGAASNTAQVISPQFELISWGY